MKYVFSDIHGRFDKYKEMVERINLSEDDTLYFLGDAIDRGPDGFKILLDMANRPNVVALMGNHEAMAIDALPGILRLISDEDNTMFTRRAFETVKLWFYNGGEASLDDFLHLSAEDRKRVWKYMKSMPLYKEVEAGGRSFVLLHGGLEGFSTERSLEEYSQDDIVWCRPDPDTTYYSDKCVIIGHTPVQFMTKDHISEPEFFKGDGFIDIDCGCVYGGGRLGCLCLDTMEEIYV